MPGWVEPRVWVDGETVTAAAFNIIGDDLEHLKERDKVHAYHSQADEMKDSRWTVLAFDSERFDSNDMHYNRGRRNRRIEVQRDGIYMLLAKITFKTDNTGERGVMVRKNGNNDPSSGKSLGQWFKPAVSGGFDTMVQVRTLAKLNRGDELRLFGYQSSGAALDVQGNSSNTTWFQVLQVASF